MELGNLGHERLPATFVGESQVPPLLNGKVSMVPYTGVEEKQGITEKGNPRLPTKDVPLLDDHLKSVDHNKAFSVGNSATSLNNNNNSMHAGRNTDPLKSAMVAGNYSRYVIPNRRGSKRANKNGLDLITKSCGEASDDTAISEKGEVSDIRRLNIVVDATVINDNTKLEGMTKGRMESGCYSLGNAEMVEQFQLCGKESVPINRILVTSEKDPELVDDYAYSKKAPPKIDSIPKVLNDYTRHEKPGRKKELISISNINVENSAQDANKLNFSNLKIADTSSGSEACVSENLLSLNITDSCVQGASLSYPEKKLLVLDLNGFLADITEDNRYLHRPHRRVSKKIGFSFLHLLNLILFSEEILFADRYKFLSVYVRPFSDDFLKFCFERFDIGIWSSRKECNVHCVVDYLMGTFKHQLKFCWGLSKCTVTGFRTIENRYKPLVLKELKKLWNKESDDLNWEDGKYSPSNTLLIDDSPYKAICNPPHTAIFPESYQVRDEEDNSLDHSGDIRTYLDRLSRVDNVQAYVRENPFGQSAITNTHPSWTFYLNIINKIKNSSCPFVEPIAA